MLGLCGSEWPFVIKVGAQSGHGDFYRGGARFGDHFIDQAAGQCFRRRNIAAADHQTDSFGHTGLALTAIQLAHQTLCAAITG